MKLSTKLIAPALFFGVVLSTPANAVLLDLGIVGGNFSAYSTLAECNAKFPRGGCALMNDKCRLEIYVPDFTMEEMANTLRKGGKISVNTMKNGYFDELICEFG